jgi:putative NIF3 family GTP cyclohydrolase 1 type 2
MDVNKKVGTSISIAEAFHATVVDSFFEECGLICEIPETNTEALIRKSLQIFDIPYVDFEGRHLSKINRIAIMAGCGDKVSAILLVGTCLFYKLVWLLIMVSSHLSLSIEVST